MTWLMLLGIAGAAEPDDDGAAGDVAAEPSAAPAGESEAADDAAEPVDGEDGGDGEDGEDGEDIDETGVDEAAAEPEVPAEPEPKYPLLWPGQCTEDAPHFDLEEVYHRKEFDQGLAMCDERLEQNPDDVDLLWMKSRFLYEIGEQFQRDDPSIDKEAHYEYMLETAQRGLELDPDNLHHRFARGIAMGRLGTTRGVLASLFMADDVEADWLAVANSGWAYSSIGGEEVLPCDAQYALGIFYRLVPDWWIVKVLAGTRGDLDKSIAFHEKATACKPHEIKNWKELGASKLCKAQKSKDDALLEDGLETLRTGLTKKVKYQRDAVDKKHIQMMIDDPSMACEYSRDGQQDLDEKKLDK